MTTSLLPNEIPTSADAARKVVEDIRYQRGHLDEADDAELRKTSTEWQDKHRRNAEKQRNVYARYTKTVADQLYSSKFRCIPELLQNADDAEYSSTRLPSLTFRLRPTEMLVDSTEDGFTRANVEAICATGESSKADDADTTGEKGLGFKSIFGIAREVHIQSGLWSFRFEHRRGEDGLGMATPIWTQPAAETVPRGIGTRFRAKYANSDDGFIQELVSEMERKTPDTTIFALRKLRKLVIAFERVAGRDYAVSFERQGSVSEDKIRIFTSVIGSSNYHKNERTTLKIVRKTISDLPFDEIRKGVSTDIVLGFQVDSETEEPIFLIQANFYLTGGREAIPDTDWNRRLREGVVETFQAAIYQFCESKGPVESKWMDFLPRSPITGFWENLYKDIRLSLSENRVLRSMQGKLKMPSALRILPAIFKHEQRPLFPDNASDIYVSDKYEKAHVEILRELGLKYLQRADMTVRLQEDVYQNPSSLLRGAYRDEDWHTTFAMFMDHLSHYKDSKSMLWKLPVIPLSTSNWVTPQSLTTEPVYLPYIIDEESVKVEIPGNLGIRKLHPKACAVSERATVYANLGISSCDPNEVMMKIFEFQTGTLGGFIFEGIAQLEILFWHGPYRPPQGWPRDVPSQLVLIDNGRNWRLASKLFFRSNKPYDAEKLLEYSDPADIRSHGFGFLHDAYMASQVRKTVRNDRTWKGFLEDCCGVRSYPTLVSKEQNRTTINPMISLVGRDNAVKFVMNLYHHWHTSYKWESWLSLKDQLKQTLVPCLDGSKRQLMTTILPINELLTESRNLGIESSMPFIKLPDGLTGELDSWKFLKELNVICDIDLSFYLTVLKILPKVHQAEPSMHKTCTKVYESILRVSKFEDEELLKKAFKDMAVVFLPETQARWHNTENCVWNGPPNLRLTHVLHNTYGFNPAVERLFVTLLKVPDATYQHALKDLQWARKSYPKTLPEKDVSSISCLYASLAKSATSESVIKYVRSSFEENDLVYAQGWSKPSQVIWNSTTDIRSRMSLDRLYPQLRDFFVQKLQVITMSVNVLVDELELATRSAAGHRDLRNSQSIRVKNLMVALGQTLAANPDDKISAKRLQVLKEVAFLPVQGPGNSGQFMQSAGDFYINDHERYGSAFLKKVKMVDFTYADMTSLQPLYDLLSLQDRYLSVHVEMETVVNSSVGNEDLTSHLRRRSYALSCCANFHRSTKYVNHNTKVHRLLMNTEVRVSEDMWTNLIIKNDGADVEVRSERALAKIEEVEEQLTIYVPGDASGLYSCYRTELSSHIAKLLGINDSTAEKSIYRILNDEVMSLKDIMRDEDIPHCSWIEEPAIPEQVYLDQPNVETDDGELSPRPQQENREVFVSSRHATSEQHSSPLIVASPSPAPRPTPLAMPNTLQRVVQDNLYRKVLQNIVNQARKFARSASRNVFNLTEIDQALDQTLEEDSMPRDDIGLRHALGLEYNSFSAFDDNVKVGAAGELFVFEVLCGLGFPNFSIDNWRSRIRSHVRAHPTYSDLRAWTDPEIADIMYADCSGQFEKFLRDKSSHSFPRPDGANNNWGSGTPIEYMIEVKTTPGPCQTPFFMSMNQYKLMKRHAVSNTGARPSTVYLIVRVYNLLSDNIQMEVFVDPWRLKDDVLEFVADPWKVIPPGRV